MLMWLLRSFISVTYLDKLPERGEPTAVTQRERFRETNENENSNSMARII